MPGSLQGPFDGAVLDQSTNEPVAGALVIASWAFEDAHGLLTPSASYNTSVITEIDGSYRLPALPKAQSRPSELLRRFTLVVYKAGYLGYRSDLRTDDRSLRRDFAQRGNIIRLDRFPQGEAHARHLVFLGAGSLLPRAAQAEGKQAAPELTESAPIPPKDPSDEPPPEPPPPPPPPPIAARVLEPTDVAPLFAQAGLGGTPTLEPLPPLPAPLEAGASGVRYTIATDAGESATENGPAVALRLWRLGSGAEARTIFDQLKARPGAPKAAAITIAAPKERATSPLFTAVPAASPPLRDGAGSGHPLPTGTAAPAAGPAKPFTLDAALRGYDTPTRSRELTVLSKQLGLVLHLRCSEALCRDDAATLGLLNRALLRL